MIRNGAVSALLLGPILGGVLLLVSRRKPLLTVRSIAVLAAAALLVFIAGALMELFSRKIYLLDTCLGIGQSRSRVTMYHRNGLRMERRSIDRVVDRVEVLCPLEGEKIVFWLTPEDADKVAAWMVSSEDTASLQQSMDVE